MTVLTPTDETELSEAVREAARGGTPLEISGGGTRFGLGRPVQAEGTLSTAAMTGITLYEPGALTLVARAGTPMSEIDAALAAEGQMFAFEPMDHRALLGHAGEPTIGGVVAVAASGPRRLQRGACRDAMIGVRFVDGQGTAISNGGRVMKNVTGYDLVKLMAGSYGTLGVLSEISFKLVPAPQATAVLLIEGLSDEAAVSAMSAALGSPYDVSGAAHFPIGLDGAPVTMIRLEGLDASVAYRTTELKDLLAAHGSVQVETDQERTAAGWKWVRDAESFADRDGAVWRISTQPSKGPGLVSALRSRIDVRGVFYDWGGGLVWLLTDEAGDAGASSIRGEVGQGGHATLMRATAATRAAVDVFQPEHDVVRRLSEGLRRKFDPKGILNPGRMG